MTDNPQPDLPARLEAVLTERFTELGNPFSEMRRHEQGPDGWPASHPVGPRQVAEVLRELLAAASVPASAPTDWIDGHPQLEAIAAAVWERCGRSDSGSCVEDDPRNIAVAALAAVLPPPADRAAILREAAAKAKEIGYAHASTEADRLLTVTIAEGLRRMADEAQQPETQADGRAAIIAEILPAWEAVYEPGNVSDYLIGYANDEAPAKAAAEAWMRSQAEVAGRLEWVPDEQLATGRYDQWFELIERHVDGIDTGPGLIVRRRVADEVQPDPCSGCRYVPCGNCQPSPLTPCRPCVAGAAPRTAREEPPMTDCPHCPDGHTPATGGSQPWSVWVAEARDGDGQPMQIIVARSAGAHVAESDAQWMRNVLNGRVCAMHPKVRP